MILNSPYITGSLTVTGNIITSGSITMSGSIASASFAASATSASYALNTTSASYALNSTSASFATRAITASYSDAFTVAGTLTAQTLVVQTITSSVDFVTGSTRFGSLLTNTHVFSGSVTMNPGGLFVSGSGLVGIGTTTPAYNLDVNGTGRFSGNLNITDAASFGGQAKIFSRITADATTVGKITDSGLHIWNTTNVGSLSQITFGYTNGSTTNASVYLGLITTNGVGSGFGDFVLGTAPSANTQCVERLRITSAGATTFTSTVQANGAFRQYAGVGYYSDFAYNGTTYNFANTETTDNVDFKIAGGGTWTSGGNFRWFTQTGGSTPIQALRITPSGNLEIGTSTKASFSYLALINDANTNGGVIAIARNAGQFLNTAGAGDMIIGNSTGENILFGNGQTGTTEYMRILSNGNLLIGTTTDQGRLTVAASAVIATFQSTTSTQFNGLEMKNGGGSFYFGQDNSAGTFYGSNAAYAGSLYLSGNYPMAFFTNGAERMRIINDSNVLLIGTTSTSPTNSGGMIFRATNAAYGGVIIMNHSTTNNVGSGFLDLYYNTSYIGGIQQNGASNVLYNTSSDYRIKEDLKDFNGLEKISAIKVYDFKWKTEDSRSHGVIAHELQEILPYIVGGEKDQVDENGKIKPQGVDYGKLTPILIKAIQELKAQNDDLQSQINELKAQ